MYTPRNILSKLFSNNLFRCVSRQRFNVKLNEETILTNDFIEDNLVKKVDNIRKKSFSCRLLDYLISPNKYNYIDKTSVISTFTQDNYTDIIIKPPNFGKSFSLNLLKYFMTKSKFDSKSFFEGKAINPLQASFNNCCVISLNLGELDGRTFESNIEKFNQQVISNYDLIIPFLSDELISSFDKGYIKDTLEKLNSEKLNLYSIRNLAKILLRVTGKHCFLLIDDYDFPLMNAAKYDFYDKMHEFLNDFFTLTIKNNDLFYKTIITATAPVEIKNLFSCYKNLQVHIDDDKYREDFGLSNEDVTKILKDESSMNLLKSVYSSITSDVNKIGNNERYSFTEVINCFNKNAEKNSYLEEFNVKASLLRLSNENSTDNSNIRFLCELTLRCLQIMNDDNLEPLFIKGSPLDDLVLRKFDSKLIFSMFFYNDLLRKIECNDSDLQDKFDIKNFAVAKHILENMPKESEFSNFQSRFILNYYLNVNYSKVNSYPNLQGFLDYLKMLSGKRINTKADFPFFRSEKELKNFFSGIFSFDQNEYVNINTLDNPIFSSLKIVVSKKKKYAIVYDCKKISKQNKGPTEETSKLMRTIKMASNSSNINIETASASDSESEVKPEMINELRVLTEISFKAINIKEITKFLQMTKYPLDYIFVVVLSNYQRQFEYKMEVIDLTTPSN